MTMAPELAGSIIAAREFTMADQIRFASLSGDHNPIHMDPIAARRTQAGEPIVHGVHVLLWLLDSVAAAGIPLSGLRSLNVVFNRFIGLGRPVSLLVRRQAGDGLSITALREGRPALSTTMLFGPRTVLAVSEGGVDLSPADHPDDIGLQAMATRTGWLSPSTPPAVLMKDFPAASAALGPRLLSGLAQTSRLVGMVCPGLRSIYSEIDVELTEDAPQRSGIGFRTVEADARFRTVTMRIAGDGLAGQVSAFVRQPPVEPKSIEEIADRVHRQEFEGVTALVLGGSRGLGAAAAKIIACGGGRVVVTYAHGRRDAERVRHDIGRARGDTTCTILQVDVERDIRAQLGPVVGHVTDLYYFATPKITVREGSGFDAQQLRRFIHFYVDAFFECFSALEQSLGSVFYPSSVFLERRPQGLTEYAMAKAAGEILCADLARRKPGLRMVSPRLPAVLTDQTAGLSASTLADPVDVMLPQLRSMRVAEVRRGG